MKYGIYEKNKMKIELSDKDLILLTRLEEELWIEETRFDKSYMNEVMADDFFEFGRSGRTYVKKDSISHEKEPINAVIPLQNLKIRLITEDVAQVTYDSEVTYDGILEKGRRSSIWSKKKDNWQLRFHQGTPF